MHVLVMLLAATPFNLGDEPAILGFTKDGTALVWTFKDSAWVPNPKNEEDMVLGEVATIAVVHDAQSGAETQYLLSLKRVSRFADDRLKARYASAEGATAFSTWKKNNPLSALSGFTGPRGAAATVKVGEEESTQWEAAGNPVKLVINRGSGETSDGFDDGQEAMYTAQRSAEVWWDPTGRRAAFAVITARAQTMRGAVPEHGDVYLVEVPAPRVEVLAPARLSAEGDKVAGVVKAAGFVVSRINPAQKDRAATVIYAHPDFMPEAKTLAAALPGATIEKLTWKANGDVVVAVGAPGAK
ncbi:MAG: LytR C-terminal domain-containing protein [Archangium sp.]|nr:LytR C-terminal domain-containing protein [Archangium sp.]